MASHRLVAFIFGPYVSSPTNTIARDEHGTPAGCGLGTLSEDTGSTRVAWIAIREVSWSCRASGTDVVWRSL